MAFDLEAQSTAARLDAELRHAHPTTIIGAALEAFGDKLALGLVLRGGVGGAAAPGQPRQ